MEYTKFLSEARENAAILPYEKMELYKRYTKHFIIETPRSDCHENIGDAEHVADAAKYLSQMIGAAPDVILLNGRLIGNTSSIVNEVSPASEPSFSDRKLYKNDEDKFAAFANGFSKTVLKIRADSHRRVNMLIYGGDTALPAQVLVNAADGSNLTLNEFYFSEGTGTAIVGMLNEINAGSNSRVELNSVHCEKSGANSFTMIKGVSDRGSSISSNTIYAGGSFIRQRNTLDAQGLSSDVEANDIALGIKGQAFDIFTHLINSNEDTHAQSAMKAVLMGGSMAYMKSLAKIKHGAKRSRSAIIERGLLYDKASHIDLIPDMSIDESDVKAMHSSSSSPISKDDLFYLCTRGINEDTARLSIALGFILETVARIKDNNVKTFAANLIRDRLAGADFSLPSDMNSKDVWIAGINGKDYGAQGGSDDDRI